MKEALRWKVGIRFAFFYRKNIELLRKPIFERSRETPSVIYHLTQLDAIGNASVVCAVLCVCVCVCMCVFFIRACLGDG